jgi:S-formylglutathione hydrolase FrmB
MNLTVHGLSCFDEPVSSPVPSATALSRVNRLATLWLATVAATVLVAGNAVARASTCPPARVVTITIPSHGKIPQRWLNYPGPPRANVLLPACYRATRRYPLLVMLNGLSQNYNDYVTEGLIPAFAGLDAIVIMPEGGSGWYADWWNRGQRGDPAWESYEFGDVLPTILKRYPILPQRRYHAIGGLSMGGLGATYLGGRLPGFFGSVASLSGFVDLNWNDLNENTPIAPTIVDGAMGLTSEPAINEAIDGSVPNSASVEATDTNPDPVLGPPDGFYYDGHNPTSLAMNLKHTRVFESTGTGAPSGADLAQPENAAALAVGAAEEGGVIYPMNISYHRALVEAGVHVTYQVHPGGHDNPDFTNEIKAMIAWGIFKPVTTHPASWVNHTVARSGRLWDLGYRFTKPPKAVVRFTRIGSRLRISAAGAQVTLTTRRGCVLRTATPASLRIPSKSCASSRHRHRHSGKHRRPRRRRG